MSIAFINRPMRRRNMYLIILIIIILEAGIFAWAYLNKVNVLKTATENLPLPTTVPAFQASIYGPVTDPMNKPMAVAISNRTIYVSDTNNQRIQVFDYDGNPVTTFGGNGETEGKFRFPYGIAADNQGQIYVADLYNGNISVFGQDGSFLKYFGEKDDFKSPAGLSIDGNTLYISDVGNNQILAYTLDGTKVLTFGKKGTADGELNSPNAVVHAGNKIYVSDTGNDRIEVFDEQGNFLLKASTELANPRGISVDPQGNIYVVSNLSSKIVVFNVKGERIFSFGTLGSEDGNFRFPNGLARDTQGRVYITDVANARVCVYQ